MNQSVNDKDEQAANVAADTASEAAAKAAAEAGEAADTADAAAKTENQPEAKDPAQEIAELNDKYLRLQAEYMNYRKRASKDIAQARLAGLTDTVVPFLQVFDLFAMAVKAAESSDNIAAIQQGLKMIGDQYKKALDELNIVPFQAEGCKFDPELHDAVQTIANEAEEGTVIQQWNCGYKLGDRLLRPARVVVSSGPEKSAEEESGSEETQEA